MISIVITCHGAAKDLPIMLMCLDQQRVNLVGKHSRTGAPVHYVMGDYSTNEREVIVSCDGALNQLKPEMEFCETITPRFNKFKVVQSRVMGGVGHSTRAPGIEAATGDWIVLTNADNYFVSGWLDRLVTNIASYAGLIFWNCVNNLWTWNKQGGDVARMGCQIKRGWIDLSCVAVRSEIAKKVGFPWTHYDADFDYIKACTLECERLGLKTVHIPEILSIHN